MKYLERMLVESASHASGPGLARGVVPDAFLEDLRKVLFEDSARGSRSNVELESETASAYQELFGVVQDPAVAYRLRELERQAWRTHVGGGAIAASSFARHSARREYPVTWGTALYTPDEVVVPRIGWSRIQGEAERVMLSFVSASTLEGEAWRNLPLGTVIVAEPREDGVPRVGSSRIGEAPAAREAEIARS